MNAPLVAHAGAVACVVAVPLGVRVLATAYLKSLPARRHRRATRRNGRMLTRPTDSTTWGNK